MGVNTVKQVLTSQLATSGTLVLTEKLDAYRHSDAGQHVLLLKNATARYIAPTDFTVAVDGRGKATVTWLHADTLASGTELNFGIWQIDSTSNGTTTGSGGGGGAITSVDLGTKAEGAATTDTGTFSLIALIKRAMGKWTSMVAALGAVGDAAWTSGDMTLTAGIKALATRSISTAPTITVIESPSYLHIAASSTDTAAGNANDLIDSILVIPTSKSPGAVSFEDGAGTNYTLFAGGTDSLSTLIPFPIDMRNITAASVGEFTTGAGLAIIVFFRARI